MERELNDAYDDDDVDRAAEIRRELVDAEDVVNEIEERQEMARQSQMRATRARQDSIRLYYPVPGENPYDDRYRRSYDDRDRDYRYNRDRDDRDRDDRDRDGDSQTIQLTVDQLMELVNGRTNNAQNRNRRPADDFRPRRDRSDDDFYNDDQNRRSEDRGSESDRLRRQLEDQQDRMDELEDRLNSGSNRGRNSQDDRDRQSDRTKSDRNQNNGRSNADDQQRDRSKTDTVVMQKMTRDTSIDRRLNELNGQMKRLRDSKSEGRTKEEQKEIDQLMKSMEEMREMIKKDQDEAEKERRRNQERIERNRERTQEDLERSRDNDRDRSDRRNRRDRDNNDRSDNDRNINGDNRTGDNRDDRRDYDDYDSDYDDSGRTRADTEYEAELKFQLDQLNRELEQQNRRMAEMESNRSGSRYDRGNRPEDRFDSNRNNDRYDNNSSDRAPNRPNINEIEIERTGDYLASSDSTSGSRIVRSIKYSGMSGFAGFNLGDNSNNTLNLGLRWHYKIGERERFELMPEAFFGLGKPANFGLFLNGLYPIQIKNSFVKPYVGTGFGFMQLADNNGEDGAVDFRPTFNLIIGTYLNVLGGRLYVDLTGRNLFNDTQLVAGYRFAF